MKTKKPNPVHYYLDEAGDTAFYKRGKIDIVGQAGVSMYFSIGLVRFNEPIAGVRQKVVELQKQVLADSYFADIISMKKKIAKGTYHFHATDDLPEVRKVVFEFIRTIDCSFEVVVGKKITDVFATRHGNSEPAFYADLLSHLISNKLNGQGKLVLNIATRGSSTKNQNLELALQKAIAMNGQQHKEMPIVAFNVQNHIQEPLLNIADYFCWAVQRWFEREEIRYYNFLKDKISFVMELDDSDKYEGAIKQM